MHLYVQIKIEIFQVFFLTQMSKRKWTREYVRLRLLAAVCERARKYDFIGEHKEIEGTELFDCNY